MERNNLPYWYVFKNPPSQIDSDVLVKEGLKRIDLLVNIDEAVEDKYIKINTEDNLVGHFALRVTAAISRDRIFKNWLIEKEGDLFALLYDSSNTEDIIKILKDLFEEKIFINGQSIVQNLFNGNMTEETVVYNVAQSIPPELLKKTALNSNSLIAAYFRYLPGIVRRRIGYLYRGWMVIPIDLIKSEVKKLFQRKLEEKITLLSNKIKENDPRYKIFQEIAQIILDNWKSRRVIASSSLESILEKGEKLYQKIDYFPPCMKFLMVRLKTTGYLSHGERLQLGLFLKRLGMSLEEQLKFWYQSAVDNVGMSWEEFDKKAGYIIRHIYGLVGSRKDYEVPKCETIINKYFCPFEALSIDELMDFLKHSYKIDEGAIEIISRHVRGQSYREACSQLLMILTKWRVNKPMSHPLLFFRIMYKRFEKAVNRRGDQDGGTGKSRK